MGDFYRYRGWAASGRGLGWAGPSVVALGYASSGPARALAIRPELWALTVAKYEYGLSLGWIDSFFSRFYPLALARSANIYFYQVNP